MVSKCLASDPSNAIGCDNMTIIIVGLLMGESDEDLQKKCKRVAVVDGIEVDPLKNDEEPAVMQGIDEQVHFEDPEAKYHF